ncbi:MAG: hypothetical protein E4H07_09820, partial [Nitrosomonadales bacterium]
MSHPNCLTYQFITTSVQARTLDTTNVSGWLFKSLLGAALLGLTFPTLAGTTDDSAINSAESKVTQDTSSPISKITTLDIEALPTNKSTATPPIKLAGNTNTLLDDASS